MARIRSIKPEFWQDRKLAKELTRDQRLFYIALWNEADDEGRFLANTRRLLGIVFPYDEDIHGGFIEASLRALADTGRVVLYTVDGDLYGQLTKFDDHQRINRPTPSRIPGPDNELAITHGGLSESSVSPQCPEVGTGEVGSRNRGVSHPLAHAREGRADVENSGTPEPDNLSDWLNGHASALDDFALYRDRRLRETLYQHYGPPGMRANAWRRPDGTSVPPEDRPRIFAVAASGYGAEGKRQLVPSEFAGVIRATVRAEVDEPATAGPDQDYRPLTDDEFARWDARKHQLIDGGMDPEAAAEQADREVRGGEEAA